MPLAEHTCDRRQDAYRTGAGEGKAEVVAVVLVFASQAGEQWQGWHSCRELWRSLWFWLA